MKYTDNFKFDTSSNKKEALAVSLLRERLQKFGKAEVLVIGNSMFPTLQENQSIFVEWQNSFDEGDIVCFFREQRFVIHRIILKFRFQNKNFYIEKGDNQKKGTLLSEKEIIGVHKHTQAKKNYFHFSILFRLLLPVYCYTKELAVFQNFIFRFIIQVLQKIFWKGLHSV